MSSGKAVLAFAAWTGAHIAVILASRCAKVLAGRNPTTFQKSHKEDESTFIGRVSSSHHNCIENLVLFASVISMNKLYKGPDIKNLAWYYVYCRMCQSVVHWTSVNALAVNTRFGFFLMQLALLTKMGKSTFDGMQ